MVDCIYYLDDFGGVDCASMVDQSYNTALNIFDELGLEVKPRKCERPAQVCREVIQFRGYDS